MNNTRWWLITNAEHRTNRCTVIAFTVNLYFRNWLCFYITSYRTTTARWVGTGWTTSRPWWFQQTKLFSDLYWYFDVWVWVDVLQSDKDVSQFSVSRRSIYIILNISLFSNVSLYQTFPSQTSLYPKHASVSKLFFNFIKNPLVIVLFCLFWFLK